MGCIGSIKNYAEKAHSKHANCLEQMGNALLAPTRWVFTKYDKSKSCIEKTALMIVGIIALAIGSVGAVFKSLGSCCSSKKSRKYTSGSRTRNSRGKSSKSTKRSSNSSSTRSSEPKPDKKIGNGQLTVYGKTPSAALARIEKNPRLLEETQNAVVLYGQQSIEEALEKFTTPTTVFGGIALLVKGGQLAAKGAQLMVLAKEFEKQFKEFEGLMNALEGGNIILTRREEEMLGEFGANAERFFQALDLIDMDRADSFGIEGMARPDSPLEIMKISRWLFTNFNGAFSDLRAIAQRSPDATRILQNMQKSVQQLSRLIDSTAEIVLPGITDAVTYELERTGFNGLPAPAGHNKPSSAPQLPAPPKRPIVSHPPQTKQKPIVSHPDDDQWSKIVNSKSTTTRSTQSKAQPQTVYYGDVKIEVVDDND